MNNGVENNQNIANGQPVLTPVTDPVMVSNTPVVAADTPTMVSSETVLTPAAPQVAQPVAPAPVAAQPQVVAAPVMQDPTQVVQPAAVPAAPETSAPVELQSLKIDKKVEKELKKNKEKEEKEKQKLEAKENGEVKPRKGGSILPLLIIILMGVGIYYFYTLNQKTASELNYKCSPVHETREEKPLDINSTLVQGLYHKVQTNIREDLAQPDWNDQMKIYLAYRQVAEYEKYDSNCNMFSAGRMEPYTCEVSTLFVPKAFKVETLYLEWKKLFGEETDMPLINVKLENDCIGGYEYIKERQEYVQGYCKENQAPSIRVKKQLKEAVSSRNRIVLVEEVQYSGNEKMDVPSYLKTGTYFYTFRLDTNYNYVLVAKTYNEKYD